MYKVAIVDDELWTLRGIKSTFKWEKYDFEVVFASTDPEEALEFIITHKPDAVFTDIKMRIMSGITLVEKIRENKINSKVVFISGFADFEYAQKGIGLKIFDYCLKPIKNDDADQLLKRLKEELDSENGADNISVDNHRFQKMVEWINQNYSRKLSFGKLAADFDLSVSYCCHLFKKNFDCSFSNYVNKIRMTAAATLLTTTDKSTIQIAEEVGFSDYYYFNKVFKKIYGITPYQYRISRR